jgi:hypothetical protein
LTYYETVGDRGIVITCDVDGGKARNINGIYV